MSAALATGSVRHSLSDRKDDCYETPEQATMTLMRVERLPRKVWEPSCGPGAIVRLLRAAGHTVVATDLVDYGLEDSEHGVDFLMETRAPAGCKVIVGNPPFKLANEFIRHGLTLAPTVIMLLRLAYLEGEGRSDIIDNHLRRVWLGRERLPMMHRRGWDGPTIGAAAMPFAWFVFTQKPTNGLIRMRRTSWRSA